MGFANKEPAKPFSQSSRKIFLFLVEITLLWINYIDDHHQCERILSNFCQFNSKLQFGKVNSYQKLKMTLDCVLSFLVLAQVRFVGGLMVTGVAKVLDKLMDRFSVNV